MSIFEILNIQEYLQKLVLNGVLPTERIMVFDCPPPGRLFMLAMPSRL
jgi:hypothetical protein